jgi:hypothetical protein
MEGLVTMTGDHLVPTPFGSSQYPHAFIDVESRKFNVGAEVFVRDGQSVLRRPVRRFTTKIASNVPVFDIGVEDEHYFFAGDGLLVHNCWFHSGTSAQMLLRAVMGEPYADLSAYAGACKIKGFRDEGGWGAQGVDFQAEKGIPTSQFWPQKSMDRANDNAATWENALLHRVQEGWIDAQAAQYDRKLSRQQVATLLLTDCPVVCDYNWWGHSVCGSDLVDGVSSFNQGLLRDENGKLLTLQEFDYQWGMNDGDVGAGFGVRIWNSWGDSWSQQGMGVLTANKAWPDGAVGLRTVTPSLI